MEIVYVVAILAAFLLGAWVRQPVWPRAREKPVVYVGKETEPKDDAKEDGRPSFEEQLNNVANYNGERQF